MQLSDYFGMSLFVGFGLWWALFPKSVIRFYTSFLRRRATLRPSRLPTPTVVRVLGSLWIVLVLVVTVLALRNLR